MRLFFIVLVAVFALFFFGCVPFDNDISGAGSLSYLYDPVLYVSFDNGSDDDCGVDGDFWTTESGHNATCGGTASINSTYSATGDGKGIHFDINVGRVVISNSTDFDIIGDGQDLSVAFWYQVDGNDDYKRIYNLQENDGSSGIMLLSNDGSAYHGVGISIRDSGTEYTCFTPNTMTINTGTWYHFVFRYNNSANTFNVTVNGTAESCKSVGGWGFGSDSIHDAYMGRRNDNTNGYAGSLDEFILWDKFLNDTEAESIWNISEPSSTSASYYGVQNITPVDISPNATAGWQTIDISAYIPSDAVGIVVSVDENNNQEFYYGIQHPDSTDDRIEITEDEAWQQIFVGTNGTHVDIYRGASGALLRVVTTLLGYVPAGSGEFLVNTVKKDVTSSSSWQNFDVQSQFSGGTCGIVTGYIASDSGSATQDFGIRQFGSTTSALGSYYADDIHGRISALSSNESFQLYSGDVDNDYYVTGCLYANSTTTWGNETPMSNISTGAWVGTNLSITDCDAGVVNGIFFTVAGGGYANEGRASIRNPGYSWARNWDTSMFNSGWMGCDLVNSTHCEIERYVENTNYAWYYFGCSYSSLSSSTLEYNLSVGLQNFWVMNETQDGVIYDYGSQENNLTVEGGILFQDFCPEGHANCAYFDGDDDLANSTSVTYVDGLNYTTIAMVRFVENVGSYERFQGDMEAAGELEDDGSKIKMGGRASSGNYYFTEVEDDYTTDLNSTWQLFTQIINTTSGGDYSAYHYDNTTFKGSNLWNTNYFHSEDKYQIGGDGSYYSGMYSVVTLIYNRAINESELSQIVDVLWSGNLTRFIGSSTVIPSVNDTCGCPGVGNNWVVALSDHCNLTDCNLGSGGLSFNESGWARCNGTINTSGLGVVPAGQVLYVLPGCEVFVS